MNAPEPAPWRKLGVIAGAGEVPVRVARACQARGRDVFVMGLEGWAEPAITQFSHDWAGLGEIGKVIRRFREEACDAVTFVGVVRRPDFSALKLDWRGARLLPKALAAARAGDDALLRMVVGVFEEEGFQVVAAEEAGDALTAPVGPLGALQPKPEHAGDIALAFRIAQIIGAEDIGQGAVACDGLTLAVEAQEGTDAMLARVATLPKPVRGVQAARRGVLAKIAKPDQERRVDLPTIGPQTVKRAARAGLAGVVVEAGAALVVDPEKTAAEADAAGLFIMAYPRAEIPAP